MSDKKDAELMQAAWIEHVETLDDRSALSPRDHFDAGWLAALGTIGAQK